MPYIGHSPTNAGSFVEIDDISSTFNGSGDGGTDVTAFTMQVGGVSVTPSIENLLIILDGVVQQPTNAFSISGSTLTFTEAPQSGTDFYGILMGQSATVGQGTITASEMAVTGNGSSGQLLKSDGDGTFTWIDQSTVTAPASGLVGNTLASGVVSSSLTSVGTLTSLTSSGAITTSGNISTSGSGTITSASSLIAEGTLYVGENIRHTGDTNNYINFTTDTQKFYTDNSVALTIDSSQNTTFAGSMQLANRVRVMNGGTVSGGLYTEQTITGSGSSSDLCIFSEQNELHFMTGGSATKRATMDNDGNLTMATGDIYLAKANNPALIIDTQEVGADTYKMYVGGTGLSFFNTTDTRGVYFKHNNDWQFGDANGTVNTEWYGEGNAKIVATAGSASNPTYCFNSDTSTGMYRPANVQLAFATDGTERLRITGTGDIWHNNGNTVEHALAGHTNELNISHHWNSGQATIHFCYRMENTYTDFTFYNGSGSGHPDLNAASFDTTSDYRMKKSVANFTDNVCDKIKLLRPITYNWKANTKMNETKQIGFLAHELQEQLPLAVKGEKDAMSEKDDTLIAPQSIKGEALSSYMMKALQEIITRLEALENA